MIVVVCLNPALDITHEVAEVDWAGTNRPAAVLDRPGGEGVNVGRILHSFGVELVLRGSAGGTTGSAVRAELRRLAVPARLTSIAGETRRTFTVVDARGRAALFSEPGPQVTPDEFAQFRVSYETALIGAQAVVLSGSLPAGLPDSSYATLIRMAADEGVPAVLDTSGAPLRGGVAAGPAIVKPTLVELEALTGEPMSSADSPDLPAVAAAAAGLRSAGAGAVVVSLGADGLFAATEDGCWRGRPAGAGRGHAGAGRKAAAGAPAPLSR